MSGPPGQAGTGKANLLVPENLPVKESEDAGLHSLLLSPEQPDQLVSASAHQNCDFCYHCQGTPAGGRVNGYRKGVAPSSGNSALNRHQTCGGGSSPPSDQMVERGRHVSSSALTLYSFSYSFPTFQDTLSPPKLSNHLPNFIILAELTFPYTAEKLLSSTSVAPNFYDFHFARLSPQTASS